MRDRATNATANVKGTIESMPPYLMAIAAMPPVTVALAHTLALTTRNRTTPTRSKKLAHGISEPIMKIRGSTSIRLQLW